MLNDPDIDAVHINTPIPNHGQQSIQALQAGKHVACTVPMATSLEECEEIVRLTEATGLKYMMMETVLYAREFLYMKHLYDSGELGKVQFLKASHQQDMDGWPNYWPGSRSKLTRAAYCRALPWLLPPRALPLRPPLRRLRRLRRRSLGSQTSQCPQAVGSPSSK